MLKCFLFLWIASVPMQLDAQSKKGSITAIHQKKSISDTHRFLETYEGTWTEEAHMRSKNIDTSTMATLTAVMVMVLDGHYLQITHTGNIEDAPFEAMEYITYNKDKKKFTLIYMDNKDCESHAMEGDWTKAEAIITFYEDTNRELQPNSSLVRKIFTFQDKDNLAVECFEQKIGEAEERKAYYKYTRQ